jgi:hypothetical protein
MPVETAADRANFLTAADFGVVAVYTAVSGGAARPISGIFDHAWAEITVGLEVGINSVSPRILVQTADLTSGGREQDLWVIEGVNYGSVDNQPDGTGMTSVRLEKR